MSSAPAPRKPSQSFHSSSDPAQEVASVVAMKELLANLHREHYKIQDLLSSLSFALRSFTNLNQFLELIPLMASRVTDADGSALILFKPNGQPRLERLHCQDRMDQHEVRRALENATRQITEPLTSNSLGGAITVNKITTALDHQVGQYLGSDVQLFGTAILVKNAERGRLYVFSRDSDYAWTETRQKLVRLVADQTAVAIANSELTAELRQKERLDRELQIGAEIQHQLLPRYCPKVTGIELAAHCKTASRVGGDYYDFIPTHKHHPTNLKKEVGQESDCWGFAIGDVMGKGVPAGLIMTMLRGMLRAEVLNGHSPGRILQHLNRVMYADLENSNRFVTMFYSEYDPETRILYYSNAAHNPPLLWQAKTKSVRRLDTWGMLIGLDADTQYQDAQVQLCPGDTVIFYTDGFTDAADRNGGRFDEENLIKHFSAVCQSGQTPQTILDYLFDQVQQFIGPNNRNEDDMTLIVMQVKPSERIFKDGSELGGIDVG